VAQDIFSTIPQGIGVEDSLSLGLNVVGSKKSITTGETVCENVVVGQFASANNGILAGTDPESDTTNTENDSERKKEADARILHTMANVHDYLEMSQGSQNLCATQEKSRAQIKQMTTVGYNLDTKEIPNDSWSLIQHDGLAAFKL
jgi:hypothetical protein